jgi:hypothetical protein
MDDYLPSWISDPYTRQVLMAIGALLLFAVLWFIWKFFFTIFKQVVFGIFVFVASGALYWYFRTPSEVRAPEVGKHAYGVSSKRYLGIVQSVSYDGPSGVTYGIRAPGGAITGYPKGSVVLRDEMIAVEPTVTPVPSPSPIGTLKNTRPRPR